VEGEPDGKVYELPCARVLKFHKRRSDHRRDVKFSYERYRGTAYREFEARVQGAESSTC